MAECFLSNGLPAFEIVGLPDAAVKESGQRVDTAIQNSGLPFQQGIFVVNLAPADLRKQGPGFDLPIALGMVAGVAEKEMDASAWCIVGELALDGTVRPVQGILPQIMEARRMGRKRIMLPQANAYEGTPVQGVESLSRFFPERSLAFAYFRRPAASIYRFRARGPCSTGQRRRCGF